MDVLDEDLSDEAVVLLAVESLFFSVELVDDESALPSDEDEAADGAAAFLESDPRLSLR